MICRSSPTGSPSVCEQYKHDRTRRQPGCAQSPPGSPCPRIDAHATPRCRLAPLENTGQPQFGDVSRNQNMADKSPATAPAPAASTAPQIRVLAQYIKDLSFENPDPLGSLRVGQAAPAIDLGIDVQARRAPGDAYEVDLN